MSNFATKIIESLFASDLYIFRFFIITLFILLLLGIFLLKDNLDYWEFKEKKSIIRKIQISFSVFYSAYYTLISIFPLLGMYGTVKSLLMLDFSTSEALANAQTNFFDALTSTVWGIIFSIIFKILYALIAPFADDYLERLNAAVKKQKEKEKIRFKIDYSR